jgi:rhamnosyl/mannosyltransferase
LGAEVRVLCINHQDRRGRDVTFRTWAVTPDSAEDDGGVRVERLGRLASVARLDVCPGLPAALRRLARWADVLHLHTPNPTMLLALAALPGRTPLVITHHSDVVRQRLLRLAQAPFERSVYRRAAAIVTQSPNNIDGSALLRRYRAKVRAVPLGIDLTPFADPSAAALEAEAKFRSECGQPLWLSVGRLVYYKGLHNGVAALRHVPGRWLVIGRGPLEGDLRRRADELGVGDRITWRDRVDPDELVGALRAATALWFPSNARSEAYGLVQVEAMASGCPVINTAIPGSGVPWVSPDGETGLTVRPDDPAALAAAARRLLDESGLRERLAEGGRRRAAAEFDWAVMARRSLGVHRESVGR